MHICWTSPTAINNVELIIDDVIVEQSIDIVAVWIEIEKAFASDLVASGLISSHIVV